MEHPRGNRRPKKITASAFHTLNQYVRHDTSFSTRTLARKLKNTGEKYNIEQLEVILQSVDYVKKTSQSNSYVNRSTQAKTCRVSTK